MRFGELFERKAAVDEGFEPPGFSEGLEKEQIFALFLGGGAHTRRAAGLRADRSFE